MWNLKKLLKPKKEPKKQQYKTISEAKAAQTRAIIDRVFYPVLKKNIEDLNNFLAKDGVRAGIEITWYFDEIKVELSSES